MWFPFPMDGDQFPRKTSPTGADMSTSVSHSSNQASRPKRKGGRFARWWITGASGLIILVVGFLIIRIQGSVSGVEFSPTHFQTREFRFFEIPLLQWQITPIHRSASTPKTATYVRQKGLIPMANGVPQTWHLVSISRGLTGEEPADAGLLVDQMNFSMGKDRYWRKWSVDHPNRATVLWPVVQRLAERELYILMPGLFELAQEDRTPAELSTAIDNYLPAQYSRLIMDLAEAGRGDLAEALLEEARADYPDSTELTSLNLPSVSS